MRTPIALFASAIAFLLTATSAQALMFPYDQQQIEAAGAGCVGGMISAHGSTAYFRGNTARLNEQMATLAIDARRYQSINVVLHTGVKSVDPAEETPQTGFGNQDLDQQVPIDWSVCKACLFEKVVTGLCQHDERSVTVHVWIGTAISLNDLNIPSGFTVLSAGEIEQFVKRHADAK